MTFGEFRKNIPFHKKKDLVINISREGIGEEKHPVLKIPDFGESISEQERTILNILEKPAEIAEKIKKPSKLKLYLNKISGLLINKNRKRRHIVQNISLRAKLTNWWRRDTTEDSRDLIKFVLIHGALCSPIILVTLTVTSVDIVLVKLIKSSVLLTILLYIWGAGSGYYILLDFIKFLKDNWRKHK